MCGADVGDHRHIGFTATRQASDLSWTAHSHLNHQRGIGAGCTQNGERDTYIVVVIALTGTDGTKGRQSSTDQFPSRGFTSRTGHRDQRNCEGLAVQQSQLLIRHQRVLHAPVQHPRWHALLVTACHHRSPHPLGRQLVQELMPIKTLPDEGHKEIPRSKRTTVGADPPQRRHGIHLPPLGLPPQAAQLLQKQAHAGEMSLNRIMPAPTRADRPSSRSSPSTRCKVL